MSGSDSRTVLVVDDDVELRDDLRRTPDGRGWFLVCARDGRDAMTVLRTVQVDVIVLDLATPGGAAQSFLDERARTPELTSVPVVVATEGSAPTAIARTISKTPTRAR
jgi:CheY-like chemotaxis protein